MGASLRKKPGFPPYEKEMAIKKYPKRCTEQRIFRGKSHSGEGNPLGNTSHCGQGVNSLGKKGGWLCKKRLLEKKDTNVVEEELIV